MAHGAGGEVFGELDAHGREFYRVTITTSPQLTNWEASFDDGATWYPLSEAAYPDSMKAWDRVAPDFCKGWCPPFITFSETPAMVQVWTGWMARTAPGSAC